MATRTDDPSLHPSDTSQAESVAPLERVVRDAYLDLAEATREMVRWRSEYSIEESADLLCVAGADPFPVGYGNCAIALSDTSADPSTMDVEDLLDRSEAFFAARDRGHTLWIRDRLDTELEKEALARGYVAMSDMPGMVLEEPVAKPSLGKSVRVELAETADQMKHIGEIVAEGYATMGLPKAVAAGFFAEPNRVLSGHVRIAIGHLDDRPAASALAILNHGVAGVVWVATIPDARGRGLAEACTGLVSNASFEAGARAVYLQASEQGEPIYRRMGYREVTRYRWLLKQAG